MNKVLLIIGSLLMTVNGLAQTKTYTVKKGNNGTIEIQEKQNGWGHINNNYKAPKPKFNTNASSIQHYKKAYDQIYQSQAQIKSNGQIIAEALLGSMQKNTQAYEQEFIQQQNAVTEVEEAIVYLLVEAEEAYNKGQSTARLEIQLQQLVKKQKDFYAWRNANLQKLKNKGFVSQDTPIVDLNDPGFEDFSWVEQWIEDNL